MDVARKTWSSENACYQLRKRFSEICLLLRREKWRFSGENTIFLCFRDAVAVRIRVFHLLKTVLMSCQQGDFVFVTQEEHCFSLTFRAGCNGTLKILCFFVSKNQKSGSYKIIRIIFEKSKKVKPACYRLQNRLEFLEFRKFRAQL